ncbi:MAG: RNA methyltransferase [Chitinophagales bacterium]|nr:RNA methyltransferase [Chitinophagales bacterium]
MRKLLNEELNRLTKDEFIQSDKTPVLIVLDNVRSLYNVGSVFRTADAFRVEAIYLCGITATPPHREIHKTALGADETVAWKYFKTVEEAIAELKAQGWKIAAIEQAEGSIALDKFSVEKNTKIALVFGNELGGVSNAVMKSADACIEIPQTGTKHSLNISVSVGVVVWEFWKRCTKG